MQINSSSASTSYYNQSVEASKKAMQYIASGKKVNNAVDNPAVLAILSKMQGQVTGLDQGSSNTQDSISLLNTSEGAMGNNTDIIQSMRQLTVQAANGTLTDDDRSAIQQQLNQYSAQMNYNATNTQFNGINTNDGSLTNFTTQLAANAGQSVTMSIGDTSASALGTTVDVSTQAAANNSIASLDSGLDQISSARAAVGAMTNGLETSLDNTTQASTNLQSASSSLGDSDIAKQATLFSQSNIQSYINMMVLTQQMHNGQQNAFSLLA